MIRSRTGLIPDAYFSGTKLKWILDHVEGARERARRGRTSFWNGRYVADLEADQTGRSHVTDYTNASRTMMFNIHRLEWDEEILEELDIPECMLPGGETVQL